MKGVGKWKRKRRKVRIKRRVSKKERGGKNKGNMEGGDKKSIRSRGIA